MRIYSSGEIQINETGYTFLKDKRVMKYLITVTAAFIVIVAMSPGLSGFAFAQQVLVPLTVTVINRINCSMEPSCPQIPTGIEGVIVKAVITRERLFAVEPCALSDPHPCIGDTSVFELHPGEHY